MLSVGRTRGEPVAQRSGKLLLERRNARSGPDASQWIQPVLLGVMQDRAGITRVWLLVQGHPEVGWAI